MRAPLPAADRTRLSLELGGSSRPRDAQRARLYAAERAAFGYPPRCLTVKEAEAMVARVLRSAWFRARWPEVTYVRFKDGRGRRHAGGHRDPQLNGGSFITIPRGLRYRWVVCHELAHVVTPNRFAAHGREFAANYLDIVRYALGREAKAALLAQFKAAGVKHRAPLRTLTDLVAEHQRVLQEGDDLLQSTPGCGTVGT